MTADMSITAVRVAQNRVLFKLPPQLGSVPHPLAYVEWFRPLRSRDPVSGLYKVSRATRNMRRYAGVVSVVDISRNCHLSALAIGDISPSWTSDNVLELAPQFLLNHYIDIDRFSMR